MLSQVKDFSIEINAIDTRTYEARFAEYKNRGENFLDNYQMIIIGFADGFGVYPQTHVSGALEGEDTLSVSLLIKEVVSCAKITLFPSSIKFQIWHICLETKKPPVL